MKSKTETHAFSLTGYGDRTTTGQATVVEYDTSDRWRRALGGLGAAWAAAIVSILIPVAHFVLVPGFGVFGIFVFFKRLGTASMASGVTGTCPDCSLKQMFDVHGGWRLPKSFTCGGCRRALKARNIDT